MLKIISYFLFFYPLAMSIIWSVGGLYHWFVYEFKKKDCGLFFDFQPPVTILVPCYNEENTIYDTLDNLFNLNYPNYVVIFINDGSLDNTACIIEKYIKNVPYYYFLDLKENLGKAAALNKALQHVQTKYVFVLDADTILDENALNWLVKPFGVDKTIGAVTGNVLLNNKNNCLRRMQCAEFMCIMGLIKRSQQIFGKLFTVSGCATLYKMAALKKSGWFSSGTATEDVDITWKIQRKFYKVLFQPKAISYIQAPFSLTQYIKQRKRWALGGWHLLKQHYDIFYDYRLWPLWVIYVEFALSCIWAVLFVLSLFLIMIVNIIFFEAVNVFFILGWSGAIISFIFLFQAVIGIFINAKYDYKLLKYGFWICWYPLALFWIGAFLIVWTMYEGLFLKSDSSGKWDSPLRL